MFDELEELVRGVTVYEFLKQEPLPGGYHENRKFIFQVRDKLIDQIDDEVRTSMGLVEERRYIDLFERYVAHVSHWIKKEKVPQPDHRARRGSRRGHDGRGRADAADGGSGATSSAARSSPDRRLVDRPPARRSPTTSRSSRARSPSCARSFFDERKKQVRKINEDLLVLLTDGPSRMQPDAATAAGTTLATMKSRFGYCDNCAKDAVLALMRKRYS